MLQRYYCQSCNKSFDGGSAEHNYDSRITGPEHKYSPKSINTRVKPELEIGLVHLIRPNVQWGKPIDCLNNYW